MPSLPDRTSLRAPAGQPPPGSSRSRTGKPVGTAVSEGRPEGWPRQRSCRWRRVSRAAMVLCLYTVMANPATPCFSPLLLLQLAHLLHVGAHEVAPEDLVEVLLGVARELLLVGGEQVPELGLPVQP